MVILDVLDSAESTILSKYIDKIMSLYADTVLVPMLYKYVFVDVDKEVCNLCRDAHTVLNPECRRYLRIARESQIALVIIDLSPPEKWAS